ncbi:MAG TPA: hypothetical protein VJY34_06930 [Roseiarcus sp.]|nr:hypothetical protein [Roseiarcus sp.]
MADRLGPLDRLLSRFVTDLTEPIVAARGEICSSIGDEVIETWKFERPSLQGPHQRGFQCVSET